MSLVQESSNKQDAPQKGDPIAVLLRGALQGDEAGILALRTLNNMMMVQNRTLRAEVEINAVRNCAKALTQRKG